MQRRLDSGPPARHTLQPGDLFISPANSHEWRSRDNYDDFLLLYLEPSLLTKMADQSALTRSFELIRREQVIQDPLLLQIGLALRAETKNASARFSAVYAQELAHAFAAHLLRRYSQWEPQAVSPHDHLSSANMRQVTAYIQDNLSEQLTLPTLAHLIGMSPYHFARLFKQSIGLSPHQYIIARRIEQAKHLLLRRDPLTHIAAQLGFADQSHLTRSFKRVVGVSPQIFLRQHSKNVPE